MDKTQPGALFRSERLSHWSQQVRIEICDAKVYNWKAPVPGHSRTHGGIIWVTGGSGVIGVNGKERGVVLGDTVLYLPGEDHSYAPGQGEILTALMVTFTGGEDREDIAALGRLGDTRYFPGQKEAVVLLPSILEAVSSGLEYRWRAAEHMLASLIFTLVSTRAKDRTASRVKPLDAAMERLYSGFDASLAQVAEELGVSSEAIRKQFRKHFEDSPMHYFTSYHVKRLALALRESNTSLRELADEFGFYDEYHLSRVFKRHMGVSPRQYREDR